MELDRSDINLQAKNYKLFGENQKLLHQKNELINELDQYKTAHDKLTAGLKEAVAESIKYKRERDELIKDLSNYRRVLKVFARLIKNKLAINASGRYIQYQHMLDEIGINADGLEGE